MTSMRVTSFEGPLGEFQSRNLEQDAKGILPVVLIPSTRVHSDKRQEKTSLVSCEVSETKGKSQKLGNVGRFHHKLADLMYLEEIIVQI